MRCDEFSVRFDELLDERREPLDEPNMAAHVAECVDCRRTAASISAVVGAMGELGSSACRLPAYELSVERILSAVRSEEAAEVTPAAVTPAAPAPAPAAASNNVPANRAPANTTPKTTTTGMNPSAFWRGSAFYALIATAATVVLAAYPIWRWNVTPTTTDTVGGGNVAVAPQAPGNAPEVKNGGPNEAEPLPSFTELARESRDSYARLADDTRRNFDDVLAVASVFSSAPPSDKTQAEKSDDWLNQVEHGLEPFTRSTLGTLDVLRQVVPADTETRS